MVNATAATKIKEISSNNVRKPASTPAAATVLAPVILLSDFLYTCVWHMWIVIYGRIMLLLLQLLQLLPLWEVYGGGGGYGNSKKHTNICSSSSIHVAAAATKH